MAEENGANFSPDQWYYSGNTSVSDVARAATADPAPVPTVPQSRSPVAEPAIRVNTTPAPSQRDAAPVWQPVKPPSADQRQQPQTQHGHSAGAYFNPMVLPITAEDQPLFASFATVLRENNVDPKVGPAIFRWYQDFERRTIAEQSAADERQRRSHAAVLQREWGAEFTSRVEQCFRAIDHLAGDAADDIFNARGPDGQLLGNNPDFLRWVWKLVSGRGSPNQQVAQQVAQGYGGGSSNVPSAGDAAELAHLRKQMGNSRSPYWYGADSKRLQARYRELIARNG